ncbi:hypothetical protein B7P43_G09691 [Cryptotermes secundus]|uniref:Uncharacterized protein n=1 Tax=Cryptotermes secundus TaxID=105785 RepID=A0A2J7Q770_9NEOP|nr:hypothetical protein B7P43_G09691 [Cryptotermes secundus]
MSNVVFLIRRKRRTSTDMKLLLMVAGLVIAMCCIMWDSVVYTAQVPDGPHIPGKPGGPACRGGRGNFPPVNATNSTG